MNNFLHHTTTTNAESNCIKYKEISPTRLTPLIDVRSPSEFRAGHIPGAVNVPLFDDEERAIVGTLYKKVGRQAAIKKGMELATPKLCSIVQRVGTQIGNDNVILYCWRGGMRSESVCHLLRAHAIQARRLAGGYKSYRQHIRSLFDLPAQYIILGGYSGSGKTALLHSLEKENIQIIDLEGLANHKGSVFGHINEKTQPTTEQFENNLSLKLQSMNMEQPIIVENESYAIGQVHVPEALLKKMRSAPLISIEVPKKARVCRLVKEYGTSNRDELIAAAQHLEKKLGKNKLAQAVSLLQQNRLDLACDLLLDYYDAYYNRGVNKRGQQHVHVMPLSGVDLQGDTKLLKMKITEWRDNPELLA